MANRRHFALWPRTFAYFAGESFECLCVIKAAQCTRVMLDIEKLLKCELCPRNISFFGGLQTCIEQKSVKFNA